MEAERASDGDRAAAHGRFARRVIDIPLAGWRDIARRVAERVRRHSLSLVAGGVSFFVVLSIFPAIASVVALYGFLANPLTLAERLDTFSGLLPAEALSLLERHATRLVEQGRTRLGLAFLTGLAVTLWIAHAGLKSLFTALNIVYEEREKRGFLRFNAAALAASSALLVVVLLLVGVTIVTPVVLGDLGLGGAVGWGVAIMRWPALALAATAALLILYRIGPSRRPPRWRWIGWGSAFTAIAWLAVSGVFSFYLSSFANYNVTYGSLGAVIGFMLWIYLSVFVLLVGAELNAEIEHQLETDTTVGPRRPRGSRGAVKADAIAPLPPRSDAAPRHGPIDRRRRALRR